MQMKKMTGKIAIFIRKNSVVLLLVLFLAVDMAFLPFIFSQNHDSSRSFQTKTFVEKDSLKNSASGKILKISEITGPRIDEAAASIEREAVICKSLPAGIWIFLLLAYIALLIFNLAFDFRSATRIQWFWELLLTFLVLSAWYVFDGCRTNIWYPLFVLKMGILIYATYLYFFDRKK